MPGGGAEGGRTKHATELQNEPEALDLFECVLSRENMAMAWQQVKANRGAAGVDGMTIDEFPQFAREHWEEIREELRAGRYRPRAVRRVLIPKASGGERPLGIATVEVHYTSFQQQFGIGSSYSPLPSTEGPEFPRPQKATLRQRGISDFALLR